MRRGAYQIFIWGWIADFPDPENFFFLLECGNAQLEERRAEHRQLLQSRVRSPVPRDEDLPNDERRADLIKRMLVLTEQERPWIELFHNEDYALSHAWVVNSKPMGSPIRPTSTRTLCRRYGRACRRIGTCRCAGRCMWRCCSIVAVTIPAVRTFYRERL